MNPLKLLSSVSLSVALLSTSIVGAADEAKPQRPNIIFLLSDDVGLGDISCYGGAFQTPNIDALAQSGTRFAQCYSTPLCGPSRCLVLTGRYPFRTGLLTNHSHDAIQPGKEVMIPTVMKKAGYATASVGKWGQMSFGPGEWGFDEYLVFRGSGRYWRDQTTSYTVSGTQKDLPAGQYLPDLMHDFVVDFISRHKEQPFFIYYPMSHIHGPIVHTPDSKPGADKDQLYTDNVSYMDKLVGKLMSELDRMQLREKTLVMFAGDNGTARFGVEKAKVDGKAISGNKGTMLEGGSRVPLVASWKGVTPAGKVSNDLVDFSDFLGTFAELGGAELPQGVTLDSHSLAPQLRGEKGNPREWVFVELGAKWYVREQGFKLTKTGELFDMSNAPFVEKPVPADSASEEAKAARVRLQGVLDKLSPATGKTVPDGSPAGKAKKGKGKGEKKNRRGKKGRGVSESV